MADVGTPFPAEPELQLEECLAGGGADTFLNLRIAAVFIILATSTTGALFPVLARRSSWLHVPKPIFECAIFLILI